MKNSMTTLSFRSLRKAPVILSLCASLMIYGCKSQEDNNSGTAANTNTQNQIQVVADSAQLSESENLTLSFYDKDGKRLEQGNIDCAAGANSCAVAITNDQAWDTVVASSGEKDYYGFAFAGDLKENTIKLQEIGYGDYFDSSTTEIRATQSIGPEVIGKGEGVFSGEADVVTILNKAKANWVVKAKALKPSITSWSQARDQRTSCSIFDFNSPMKMACFAAGKISMIPGAVTYTKECKFGANSGVADGPGTVRLYSQNQDYFEVSKRWVRNYTPEPWSKATRVTQSFQITVYTETDHEEFRARACNSYGCSSYITGVVPIVFCSP